MPRPQDTLAPEPALPFDRDTPPPAAAAGRALSDLVAGCETDGARAAGGGDDAQRQRSISLPDRPPSAASVASLQPPSPSGSAFVPPPSTAGWAGVRLTIVI
jgi:hypothetical protein